MKFTQPCFIRKNTKELRDKLLALGYTLYPSCYNECTDTHLIANIPNGYVYSWKQDDYPCMSIDCGTNEELFLAIAALRDDNIDNHQWFTDGKGYWQQCVGSFRYPSLAHKKLHKATVQELVEYFNK